MSVPAVNVSYFGQGPVAGGSTTLAFGGSSTQELAYIGTASLVLDGSLTTGVVNFVDGTNNLAFTPTAVVAFRTGGNGLSTIAAVGASTINAQGFTLTFSAAGTNTNVVTFAIMVLK